MNRKTLSIALAAAMALPVLAAHEGTAEADRRVRVRARGHVRVGTPARVRVRTHRYRTRTRYRTRYRPRYRYRYRVYPRYRLHVGGSFYYGWRYAAPPPCDYECSPRAHYVEPRPRVAVTAPEPERPFPRFGLGLFAGGMNVEDREASSDIGVLGRFRLTRSLALEGEIAKSEIEDSSRIDRRLGVALLWDLAPRSSLSPHLLVGLGAVRADIDENGDSSHADQAYAEIGAGLGWRLSRHLELSADIRAGSRETRDGDVMPLVSTTSEPAVQEDEAYTRARLSAILNF